MASRPLLVIVPPEIASTPCVLPDVASAPPPSAFLLLAFTTFMETNFLPQKSASQ